jgi:hypothetical protein
VETKSLSDVPTIHLEDPRDERLYGADICIDFVKPMPSPAGVVCLLLQVYYAGEGRTRIVRSPIRV